MLISVLNERDCDGRVILLANQSEETVWISESLQKF